eukprot:1160188-Pelagomonas_calceolata.AAC.5
MLTGGKHAACSAASKSQVLCPTEATCRPKHKQCDVHLSQYNAAVQCLTRSAPAGRTLRRCWTLLLNGTCGQQAGLCAA